MIRLYRAPFSTNCERVALALAYKGLEAESVVIDYSDRSRVEEVSGQGLVPVIEDDGEVVVDSTWILRHLEQRYPDPPLFPAEAAEAAQMNVFLEWFNMVWKAASNSIADGLASGNPDRDLIDREAARMADWLDLFEGMLEGRNFLFGNEVSAADFAAFPFLKFADRRDPDDDELYHRVCDDYQQLGDDHPRLAAWIDRVDALPRA